MTTQHTPTPWRVAKARTVLHIAGQVRGLNKPICHITLTSHLPADERLAEVALREANAAFIVRACNAHGLLVSAAKEALEFIEKRTPGIVIDAKDALRIAIAKAEGK